VTGVDVELRAKDGAIRHVRGSAELVEVGADSYLFAIAEDLSEELARRDELSRTCETVRTLTDARRRLAARLNLAVREERARISRELHDSPLQALVAARLRLYMIEEALGAANRAEIEPLEQAIESAISSTQALISGLLQPVLVRNQSARSGQPSSAWPGCSRRNRRRTSTYRVGVRQVKARNSWPKWAWSKSACAIGEVALSIGPAGLIANATFTSSLPASWNDLERRRVGRTNDREVPAIEGGDLHDVETLGRHDDRGVHGAQRRVSIGRHELGDPDPVRGADGLGDQVPGRQVTQESDLGVGTDPGPEQVGHLAHHELGDDQRPGVSLQKGETGFVVPVVFVDVRVERPGIDDQRDLRASRRRISSIRRAVSFRPLRPALAAINLR
jgi:hypothetical protein